MKDKCIVKCEFQKKSHLRSIHCFHFFFHLVGESVHYPAHDVVGVAKEWFVVDRVVLFLGFTVLGLPAFHVYEAQTHGVIIHQGSAFYIKVPFAFGLFREPIHALVHLGIDVVAFLAQHFLDVTLFEDVAVYFCALLQ